MDDLRALSVGQESLWLLYKLAPAGTAYNDAGAGLLDPVPDVDALAKSVRLLSSRHDLLRSVFREPAGIPGRLVRGTDLVELEVRDVPGCGDADLRRMAREIALTPFTLETDGPARVVLLRREDDAALVVGDHHIATDATSQFLIWRDLLAAYRRFVAGREPDLPPVGGDYDEYVAAERRLLASARRVDLEAYWRAVCAGAVAGELPTDRPRPARQRFAGATHARRLDPDLVDRIATAAARHAATPFAFLLGVFQSLVYRYTGQEDFLLGCPTTTRRGRRTRDVVGYFVNALVLRARFDRGTTFAAAVQAASEQVVRGNAHARYPFPMLLELLGRTAGAAPLFRLALTMVNANGYDSTLDRLADGESNVDDVGLRMAPLDVPRLEGQCDLNVEITRSATGMTMVFRYDTDLFDEATVARLVATYLRLLEVAVAEPSTKVGRAPLMDDAERARVLALGAS